MPFSIDQIDIFVRETPPDRMSFSIGKSSADPKNAIAAKKRRPRAILLVRMKLTDSASGKTVTACSGDRPSFGWLDKRADRTAEQKLVGLISMVEKARSVFLDRGKEFMSPFTLWHRCYEDVMALGREIGQENLMASYACAMFERAVIDGVCRIQEMSFFNAVKKDKLGIQAGLVQPELKNINFPKLFPKTPRTEFAIRHTVGLSDPIVGSDIPAEHRVNDGEPETLEEYAKRDGLRFFKIKISGDTKADLVRLENIWSGVLMKTQSPSITLDGNEAYRDIEAFSEFVSVFERELTGMFQHTLFIEQPLTRALTHDPATAEWVRTIGKRKSLAIDEADGTNDSFKKAFGIGYDGTSHKNCKGVFKSLLNHGLAQVFQKRTGREAFLSGEDLSNMPIVPLHQDFATLSLLGISHCERNGHHYGFGLSHLTDGEKALIAKKHQDLYEKREGEWFLKINNGVVKTASLQEIGFGGSTMPDWESLTKLADWKRENV